MTRTVLIAGYGAFGALHAAAWRLIPGIRVAVAERSEDGRARARADGVETVFAEAADCLGDVDLVDIVTPPDTHLPMALPALGRGLPVLIEKPATRTVEDAIRLRDAAGVIPVQVGLILRAHPLVRIAREMLAEGAIGHLVSMAGDFSGWKRMRDDSSLLENDGVHFLDLMRHLSGSPIAGIDAWARALLGGKVDDIHIETTHANGMTGDLRLGLLRGGECADSVVPGAVTRKALTLSGDGGILTLDFNRNRLFHGRVDYRPAPGGWHPEVGALQTREVPGGSTVELLRESFESFLAAVDGDGEPVCNLAEGAVELARVLAAIETALGRKRPEGIRLSGMTEDAA